MNTKTTTIRLEEDLIEQIDSRCDDISCTRNDFIKSAIEAALKKEDDDAAHKPYHDDLGNRWYWSLDRNDWVCELNPKNVKIIP